MSDDVTTRELYARLHEQEKRWLDRFDAMQRAVDSAAAQLERRLSDFDDVSATVRDLQRAKSYLDGRLVVVSSVIGGVFGFVAALLVRWVAS